VELKVIMSIFSKTPTECDKAALLIVDDEPSIRSLFSMIISQAHPDLKIDEACNGLEAVRSFREKRHCVILMDIRMPLMDGLQAFLTIERECKEKNVQIPAFVFCTGFSPPDAVSQIIASRKRHILLLKPPQSAALLQAITASLQSKTVV